MGLYEKFMCYCKTNGGALEASIAAANTKIPAVGASIKASEEQKAQLEEELKQAQTDRSDAKTALSDATALREKEATEFAALKADFDANIVATKTAEWEEIVKTRADELAALAETI